MVQFILISRNYSGETITRINLGAISIIAGGYIIYLAIKIRNGINKLKNTGENNGQDTAE